MRSGMQKNTGLTNWKEQIDILKDECGLEYQIRMNDKNVRMEK